MLALRSRSTGLAGTVTGVVGLAPPPPPPPPEEELRRCWLKSSASYMPLSYSIFWRESWCSVLLFEALEGWTTLPPPFPLP